MRHASVHHISRTRTGVVGSTNPTPMVLGLWPSTSWCSSSAASGTTQRSSRFGMVPDYVH